MPIVAALWHNHDKLISSFHAAIIYGMTTTWRRCDRLTTTPQEPDFVAGLVTESTPLIHAAINSVFSPLNISLSVCSVFCHQTPQVTFGSNPSASCELGDILLAYVHTPRTGPPRRNAILFQAKTSARHGRQTHYVRKGEKDQLRLYRDWPDFEYTRSSFFNGQKRSVTPKSPHPGAQYMLIDHRPPSEPMSGLQGLRGTSPVGCGMPYESLREHTYLAAELFNLFIFRTGRPFEDKIAAAKKQDWSQVVWDLLEIGVKKSFQRKNSDRHFSPRHAGDTVELLDGMTFARSSSMLCESTVSDIVGRDCANILFEGNNDVPLVNCPEDSKFNEPEGGVSIVLIETSELAAGSSGQAPRRSF